MSVRRCVMRLLSSSMLASLRLMSHDVHSAELLDCRNTGGSPLSKPQHTHQHILLCSHSMRKGSLMRVCARVTYWQPAVCYCVEASWRYISPAATPPPAHQPVLKFHIFSLIKNKKTRFLVFLVSLCWLSPASSGWTAGFLSDGRTALWDLWKHRTAHRFLNTKMEKSV